jgi:sigma-B regulation protein RsbU (phosphoserine phosphatase)
MSEKILVADDSEDNRLLVSRILHKAGYEILEADDGEAVVQQALSGHPDLVLLDIVMPGRDGFEVCRILKEDHRTADIPVIFLSSMEETKDKIKGLELGGVDYIVKPFDSGEILARVRSQLNIRRLNQALLQANRDLQQKQQRLDDDLKAAAGIQQSLLPQTLPELPDYHFAWKFLPSEVISGDIFNVFLLDQDHIGIYILDVSGHGVPAAMVTVSVSQMLHIRLGGVLKKKLEGPPYYALTSPQDVLHELDREYPLERFGKFFTIVYSVIRISDGHVVYSSAGHPPPLLLRADGSLEHLEAGGAIVGLGHRLPFEEGHSVLKAGDKLFFYTDGLVEFQNEQGIFFGMNNLESGLQKYGRRPIRNHMDDLMRDFEAFKGDVPLQDDVSILAIQYKA